MAKIYNNGEPTTYGKGFENGYAWGLFSAGVMFVLVVAL